MSMRCCLFLTLSGLVCVSATTSAQAAEVKVIKDLAYKEGPDLSAGEVERCRLDLYLPAEGSGFTSLLWLHGGGLAGGSKESEVNQKVAERLAEAGIIVGMAEYRLNPAVRFPAYVNDAAAAFAWLHENVALHGGDPGKVFIGGHSAGAYLALMVSLDGQYIKACGLDESALAGVVAISGQTTTHVTVREERMPGVKNMMIDDAAPLYHVGRRSTPFLILYADEDMPMRADENRLLASALRHAGCEAVADQLCEGRNHGTIFSRIREPGDPVAESVIRFLDTTRAAPAVSP